MLCYEKKCQRCCAIYQLEFKTGSGIRINNWRGASPLFCLFVNTHHNLDGNGYSSIKNS